MTPAVLVLTLFLHGSVFGQVQVPYTSMEECAMADDAAQLIGKTPEITEQLQFVTRCVPAGAPAEPAAPLPGAPA